MMKTSLVQFMAPLMALAVSACGCKSGSNDGNDTAATGTESDADSDGDTGGDGDTDGDSDGDSDSASGGDTDTDGGSDSASDGDTDTDGASDSATDSASDGDPDSDGGSDSDSDNNTNSDTESDTNSETDTTPFDPFDLAKDVSQQELVTTISALADLGTRYTFTDGDNNARVYIQEKLEGYGYTVELDEFSVSGESTANVIAKKVGTETPEVVYIFSAHYDSTSTTPETLAPGADDNATGVAGVIEAARVMAPHAFKSSLWFVLTGAEEQGSKGSAHMIEWLKAQDIDVRGVIAPDMFGYWPLEAEDKFDILGDEASEFLVDQMAEVADVLGVGYKKHINHDFCYGDDHTNFQEAGFPAITPMDCVEAHNIPSSGETLPHYHKPTDTVDTLYMPLTTDVTRVIVVHFAILGEPVAR
jgi:hypothetical protein